MRENLPCHACSDAAVNPNSGHYTAGCQECQLRAIAQSPMFWNSQRVGRMTDHYIKAMRATFGADWKEWHPRVKAWAARIAESKR